jgi:hypothetical protein
MLDDQICPLYPAEAPQRKEGKLGLIKGLAAPITYGKKTKPTAFSLHANNVGK